MALLLSAALTSCATSSGAGTVATAGSDPCDQQLVFDGKETVAQFQARCPTSTTTTASSTVVDPYSPNGGEPPRPLKGLPAQLRHSQLTCDALGKADVSRYYELFGVSGSDGIALVDQVGFACDHEPQARTVAQAIAAWDRGASVTSSTGNASVGGTDAAWNRQHTGDPGAGDPGYAYDPGTYPEGNDRFIGVTHLNGRVNGLTEYLPAETSVRSAVKAARAVLPRDATYSPVTPAGACATVSVSSATLQRELGSPDAIVIFASGVNGDHYDPADVTELTVNTVDTSGPAC
jgi:hypothetical protein